MNEKLIEVLKKAERIPGYSGMMPEEWYTKVHRCKSYKPKPEFKLKKPGVYTREDLKGYLKQKGLSDETALIAILAWGKCSIANGRNILEDTRRAALLRFIKELKSPKIKSREEAFDLFVRTKKSGSIKGLGVAYFTKVLWFMRPDLNGYILDRYTAKSINILCDSPYFPLIDNKYVSQHTDANTYEGYCKHIEKLAKTIKCTPEITEEKLFGGDYPAWREKIKQLTK